MRYYFKSLFWLLLSAASVSAMTMDRVLPYQDEYMGVYAVRLSGFSEIKKGSALFLGYENQVTGGAYNGCDDYSANIYLGYESDGLIIRIIATDDDVTGGEKYSVTYGWKGGENLELSWTAGELEPAGGTETRDKYGRVVTDLKLPWPGGDCFFRIPLMFQLKVTDKDSYGVKMIQLSEEAVSVNISADEEGLPLSLKILAPGEFQDEEDGIYCEAVLHDDGEYLYKVLLNGSLHEGSIALEKGINSFLIRDSALKKENGIKLSLDLGGLTRSVEFELSKQEDIYRFKEVKNRARATAEMKKMREPVGSPRFDKKYESFKLKETSNGKYIVLIGSYDDLYSAETSLGEGFGVTGFVIGPESDRFMVEDVMTHISGDDSIVSAVIFDSARDKVFQSLMNNPEKQMPYLIIPYPRNMERFFFEMEADNMKNYEITVLYDKNREDLNLPRYIRKVPLTFTVSDAYWEYAMADGRPAAKNWYLYSNSLSNSRVGDVKIYAREDDSVSYFSFVLVKGDVTEMFAENISYFVYESSENEDQVILNGNTYPIFRGNTNRFFRAGDKEFWNIMVSQRAALPGFSDFFRERLSACDRETREAFKRDFGHLLFESGDRGMICYGDELPRELQTRFHVTDNGDTFISAGGKTISKDKGFAALFQDNGAMLLWCNINPLPFSDQPLNYVVIDEDGEISEAGTVFVK